MRGGDVVSRSLVALSLMALMVCTSLLPRSLVAAQGDEEHRGQSSPAAGSAAVIAQGVAPLPAAEFGWQVTAMSAVAPLRVAPTGRAGGFILPVRGNVAVTDER